MADTVNTVAKKKTKKKTRKKVPKKKTNIKTPARKKTAGKTPRKKTTASNRKAAAASRKALTKKLRADLKSAQAALSKARVVAAEELKLVRAAARDEIAVLKDQLDKALKREKELRKISEKKAKKMLAAGEAWEKKQLEKLRKAAKDVKSRRKK